MLYFENEKANGNAWFVDAIETFETADEEILAFDKINTKTTATANASELKSQTFCKRFHRFDSIGELQTQSFGI